MARVVHLPSTPPVAEDARLARGSASAGSTPALLRRFPATALAGAVAVGLIVVALAHPAPAVPPPRPRRARRLGQRSGSRSAGAAAPGAPRRTSACTQQSRRSSGVAACRLQPRRSLATDRACRALTWCSRRRRSRSARVSRSSSTRNSPSRWRPLGAPGAQQLAAREPRCPPVRVRRRGRRRSS